MKLGDVLKKLRNDRDLQQSDIAKLLNVDRSTVGKWENNSSFPDPIKLDKLATYFNVSTDYLLGREEIHTIAAHKDGAFTDQELEEIEAFKKFVLSKRKE